MELEDFKVLKADELRLELMLGSLVKKFYYYRIFKNNEHIGNCGIRFNLDEYYGNIEYEIFENYRGNNYAYKACKILSSVALSYGIEDIKITASPKNIPSNKTIEKLGSKLIECKKVPRNHKLYRDSHYMNIYNWHIEKER